MRARRMRVGLASFAALTLFVIPSLAQGRGRGHGKAQGNHRTVFDSRNSGRHDRLDRRDRGRVVIVDDRVFFGDRSGGNRPPGWDRGRKVGWGNCDMPPGLAKKHGCRNNSWFGDGRRDDRRWDRRRSNDRRWDDRRARREWSFFAPLFR